MKNMKKVLIIGGTALVLVALFIAGARLYQSGESQRVQDIASTNLDVFVRPHSPQIGNPDAKVTVVEFLDPECESCRAVHPYVKDLLKQYEGKVKLVIRYTPFHHNSKFAIRVLEAARKQGKFEDALDIMFHHQPEWGSHHNPRPELIFDVLPQVFINVDRIKRDMNDPAFGEVIRQDEADGQTLGVRGTPTFFVNGRQAGSRELARFVQAEVEKHY